MTAVKQTAFGIKDRVKKDRLSLVAAGVAFYTFLSIFPALATVISIYGLVADPQMVQQHIISMSGVVPKDVMDIVSVRMEKLASSGDSSLTLGVVIGIVVSLWSANKAMKAVSESLNIAYDKREDRGFIRINLVTLLLTLLSSIGFIVALSVVVIVPIFVSVFLSQNSAEVAITLISWVVFIALLVGMFLVLYRFAPARTGRPRWIDLLPGALFSAFLFVLASLVFSFYVSNFGKYDEQYGALGAVVVTMLWLFIGAFIFLLGAELNAERNQSAVQGQGSDLAHAS